MAASLPKLREKEIYFTPDHISHYFHHARHPQSIIGAHIIF